MNYKNTYRTTPRYRKKKGRGKYKRVQPISTRGFTKELLMLMAQAGLMISLTALVAGHPHALLPLARFTKYGIGRFMTLLKRLERQRYLVRQKRGREELVALTDLGKEQAAFYALRIMPHPTHTWDGLWRICLFDVPNEAHIRRNTLRREIKRWGFYPLQKSVFVYPYPCPEFMKLLGEATGLTKCCLIIETSSLGPWDKKLLYHFRLS